MKYLYIILVFVILNLNGYGQFSPIDCSITQAYVTQNMGKFDVYLKQLDALIAKQPNIDLQFKRMKLRHLYIAHLLFSDAKSELVEHQLACMDKELSELEKSQKYGQKCLGFRAAYSAYVALESPTTAIYYLPKSFSIAKQAIKTQASSPYSWAEYGNLEYCYALYFGGNYTKAISAFTKSIELFQNQGLAKPCNWYYINTLLFLAKSYEDNKQFAEANKVFDSILALTPEFTAIHRWKHKLNK